MKNYARIVDGIVFEVIEGFSTSEGEIPIEERFSPEIVATLVLIPGGVLVSQNDTYDGTDFGPPPPPVPPATAEQVLAERSARMAQATAEIAPLQDLVDMDEADEDDEAKLLEWKQYRAAVSKVQTQPGYPSAVVWPDVPTI